MIHEAILERAPSPARAVNARIPPELDGIIGKALEKDRDLRYQHASEMRADLKRVKRDTESGRSAAVAAPTPRSKLRPWLLGVTAVILVAAAVFYLATKPTGLFRISSPPVQPTHMQITFVGDATYPALSPDGKSVAYVTGKFSEGQRLMLQDLKGGQAIELSKGTEILNPRWSPDGSELAVLRRDPTQEGVFLIPRLGGPSRLIGQGAAICWSPNGSQIATAWGNEGGLFKIVDVATGSTRTARLRGVRWTYNFDWSLASNLLGALTDSDRGKLVIWTFRPDGSRQRKVIEEEGLGVPRWSPAGDGIYFFKVGQRGTQELLKVPIDPKSGEGPRMRRRCC
jgi:hypothetical protein